MNRMRNKCKKKRIDALIEIRPGYTANSLEECLSLVFFLIIGKTFTKVPSNFKKERKNIRDFYPLKCPRIVYLRLIRDVPETNTLSLRVLSSICYCARPFRRNLCYSCETRNSGKELVL